MVEASGLPFLALGAGGVSVEVHSRVCTDADSSLAHSLTFQERGREGGDHPGAENQRPVLSGRLPHEPPLLPAPFSLLSLTTQKTPEI